MQKTKVLVVDDSALMRRLITHLLSQDPQIDVVGAAEDAFVARDMIKALQPDVITLDVEMPRMDGLTFLRKLMELRPMPVVMLSSLTQAGAHVTLEALEVGAVDFVGKPVNNDDGAVERMVEELCTRVKMAARTRISQRQKAPAASRLTRKGSRSERFVFIGASTGGVEALKLVLHGLPPDMPPILITQHMPERFTEAFAQRLNRECALNICEARQSQPIVPGTVYIAPGSHHLRIERRGTGYVCALGLEAPVSGHRPSVDVLFRSAADTVGSQGVGVILTGMGRDGAEGLLAMRKAGAITYGQDEKSALIYGMPRVAFERGGVMRQFPLDQMPQAILDACTDSVRATAS